MRTKAITTFVACLVLTVFFSAISFASVYGLFEGYPIVKVIVDGREIKGDVPAINFNGRTMVPVRFVAEALGAQVDWDSQNYTVIINSGSSSEAPPVAGTRIGKDLPKTFTEKGVSVTLISVEATPSETILKVKVTNNTSSEVMFGAPTAQLVAGSKQFDQPSNFDLTFIDNLKPGVTKEGLIKFPALPAGANTVRFYVHYFIIPGLDMTEAKFEVEF